MIEVKIKNIDGKGVIPKYIHSTDAGMDIVATSETIVDKGDHGYIEYGTNLAFLVPEGYYMDIRPRSSISNTGMILSNSCGVLDAGYTGELKFRFKWIKNTIKYNVGDRIGQIFIVPIPKIQFIEVEEFEETSRGTGGFGSTNKE